MNFSLLNVASVLLGLVAWCIPTVCIIRKQYTAISSLGSFAACIFALLMQMIYQWHLVDIEDWSALLDTSEAVVRVSAFLAVTTIALNLLCVLRSRKKANK